MTEDKLVLFEETLQKQFPQKMSEKGAEDISATVADTHSSRRLWSD